MFEASSRFGFSRLPSGRAHTKSEHRENWPILLTLLPCRYGELTWTHHNPGNRINSNGAARQWQKILVGTGIYGTHKGETSISAPLRRGHDVSGVGDFRLFHTKHRHATRVSNQLLFTTKKITIALHPAGVLPLCTFPSSSPSPILYEREEEPIPHRGSLDKKSPSWSPNPRIPAGRADSDWEIEEVLFDISSMVRDIAAQAKFEI